MKNLNKKTKRILSFMLALLMVMSTLFVSGNQEVKANELKVYEIGYDKSTETITGAPQAGDIIAYGDMFASVSGGPHLDLHFYANEEHYLADTTRANGVGCNEDGYNTVLENGFVEGLGWYDEEEGWTLKEVSYDSERNVIVVCMIARGEMDSLDDGTSYMEVQWDKLAAFEVGALIPEVDSSLVSATGIEGIEGLYIVVKATQEHVAAGYITQEKFESTLYESGWLGIHNYSDEYKISETDEYGCLFVMYASDFSFGYTNGADFSHKITLVNDNVEIEYTNVGMDGYQGIVMLNFGTGAEVVSAIKGEVIVPPTGGEGDDNDEPSNPPTGGEGDDNDEPSNPPTEDGKDENESSELMDVFNEAIFEFYEFFIGIKLTDEATSYLEEGEEIHPFTEGTAQYIDEGRSWWVSCAWINSGSGVVIHLLDLNDASKADEIAEKYGDWEYYQSFPTETFQYNNGEYLIWAVIPEEYIAQGITFDVLKSYLDTYYNEATNPVVEENDYAANIANKNEVAEKIELTEAEKKAIANGGELEVILTFKDNGAEATTEEQKAIVEVLEDKKVGTFLEIDLTKKIGAYEAVVSETTGMVAITFELPETLKNAAANVERTYSVVRYHDGEVEVLDATYDEATGTITFETDKFSTYAVVYEDVAVKAPETTPEKVPTTGDATNIAFYIMLFVCGAGLVVVSKKQNIA